MKPFRFFLPLLAITGAVGCSLAPSIQPMDGTPTTAPTTEGTPAWAAPMPEPTPLPEGTCERWKAAAGYNVCTN
ncbi:MAG: hypothetical protein AAF959_22050 [Cyanobacteria bacterium P01_D01_bin.56]